MFRLFLPLIAPLLVVFVIGRTGGKSRLRTPELIILLVVLLVVALLFHPIVLYQVFGDEVALFGLFGTPVIQVAIGLVWIRRKRGFIFKPSIDKPSPIAALPQSEPLKQPVSTTSTLRNSTVIFLSYRRTESGDVTGRIYDRLVLRFGQDSVFKDVDSIPLGADFRDYIANSVAQCRVFLAVVGERWVGKHETGKPSDLDNPRDFVRIEIESALQRHVPVVPVLVQGAQPPQEDELPDSIKQFAFINAIPVRPDPDFNQDIARLINGIEKHLSNKIQ